MFFLVFLRNIEQKPVVTTDASKIRQDCNRSLQNKMPATASRFISQYGRYRKHSVLLNNWKLHHLFHAFTLPRKLPQTAPEQLLAQKRNLSDFCTSSEASVFLLTCYAASCHHRTAVPPAITKIKSLLNCGIHVLRPHPLRQAYGLCTQGLLQRDTDSTAASKNQSLPPLNCLPINLLGLPSPVNITQHSQIMCYRTKEKKKKKNRLQHIASGRLSLCNHTEFRSRVTKVQF